MAIEQTSRPHSTTLLNMPTDAAARARQKRYRDTHKAELRDKNRVYRQTHESFKQHMRDYAAAYAAKQPASVNKQRCKKYYESHKAARQANQRQYVAAHREENAAKSRQYYAAHKEQHRRRQNAYDAGHAPQVSASKAAWQKRNPDIHAAHQETRRARVAGAPVCDFTSAQWRECLALHQHRCFYCGTSGPLTQEHKTPLTRGGAHTASNIVPACRRCNSKKGTKTAEEFIGV